MNKVKKIRKFQGKVISDKMKHTITVEISRSILDSKYKKRFQRVKKFYVHDPKDEASIGDEVEFVECRPLSKTKRWRIVKVVN